jgi:hypothetical protein
VAARLLLINPSINNEAELAPLGLDPGPRRLAPPSDAGEGRHRSSPPRVAHRELLSIGLAQISVRSEAERRRGLSTGPQSRRSRRFHGRLRIVALHQAIGALNDARLWIGEVVLILAGGRSLGGHVSRSGLARQPSVWPVVPTPSWPLRSRPAGSRAVATRPATHPPPIPAVLPILFLIGGFGLVSNASTSC